MLFGKRMTPMLHASVVTTLYSIINYHIYIYIYSMINRLNWLTNLHPRQLNLNILQLMNEFEIMNEGELINEHGLNNELIWINEWIWMNEWIWINSHNFIRASNNIQCRFYLLTLVNILNQQLTLIN